MQNQGSPRLKSTIVKQQQQNHHGLRRENRSKKELRKIFLLAWVCAAGHYFQLWLQSFSDLRCSRFGSDTHLPWEEGTSPLRLAAHCWLLTEGNVNYRLPDPFRDHRTSCARLPVKAFLPGAHTVASLGKKEFLSSSGGKPEPFMAWNTNQEPS